MSQVIEWLLCLVSFWGVILVTRSYTLLFWFFILLSSPLPLPVDASGEYLLSPPHLLSRSSFLSGVSRTLCWWEWHHSCSAFLILVLLKETMLCFRFSWRGEGSSTVGSKDEIPNNTWTLNTFLWSSVSHCFWVPVLFHFLTLSLHRQSKPSCLHFISAKSPFSNNNSKEGCVHSTKRTL